MNNNNAKHFVFTLLPLTAVVIKLQSINLLSNSTPPSHQLTLPYLASTPHPSNLTYLTNARVGLTPFR